MLCFKFKRWFIGSVFVIMKSKEKRILDILKDKLYLTTQGNLRLKDKILTCSEYNLIKEWMDEN